MALYPSFFTSHPTTLQHGGDMSATCDAMAEALAGRGWCVVQDFFDAPLLDALRSRLEALETQQALAPAGIGRGADNAENARIRRDHTRWLERHDAAEAAFLSQMEFLRHELNRRLMLGLFLYEAHFARYDTGAFYARHFDSFRGRRNRIISTVLYLNPGWQPADGGFLALYANSRTPQPFLTVAPELGTFVLFLSEEVPHEVLPALRPRASVAGWFRCNDKSFL